MQTTQKITIPKTLEIGGYTFTIEASESTSKELIAKAAFADSNPPSLKRIRLDPNNTNQQINNDFIHELIHCIDYVYSENRVKEGQVSGLANGLQQVFKQLGIQFVLGDNNADSK